MRLCCRLLPLLLCVLVTSVHARTTVVQWDDTNIRLTGFILVACVVDGEGQCMMHEVQRLSPRRLRTQVQVPGRGVLKCFQVLAVRNQERSSPSERLCLTQ